jgi:hypothetical protein
VTAIQTEFPFVLPHGYVDGDGTVHREGVMRLATAYDEVAPLRDPRVQANPGYLVVILLARVITRLGDLSTITPKVIEELFAGDLAHLESVYRQINENGSLNLTVTCPHCDERFEVETSGLGG